MSNIGEQLRDEGMTLASDAEERDNNGWSQRALDALYGLAAVQQLLDSNDLRAVFDEEPLHPGAWGSVWKKAINRRWIEEALGEPRRPALNPRQHAMKVTRYRSLVWL